MQLKEFDIILDIKRSQKTEEFEVVQGDSYSNVLNITLMDGLNPFILTNTNVEIVFYKSDGTTVQQTGIPIISELQGKIQCVLKTNTIASPGKVIAEVRVLQEEILLTPNTRFQFYVRKSLITDETIESTNEFPILNKLINDTKNIVEAVPVIEGKLEEITNTESDLNVSIATGNTLKAGLDNSMSEGNTLKVGLDDSIVQGNVIKGEIDDIIKNTDFEQVLIELNNKADKTELESLAGEGRTTETVKGNADDLVAHMEESNAHGNNGNILYFEDKTQIMKPLEEVFKTIPINSQQEFDDICGNISNTMSNYTHYKRSIGLNVGIPSIGGYGGTWSLEGYKTSINYEWQRLTGYLGDLMYFRVKNVGTWSPWYQIATSKPIPWINATLQGGWTGTFRFRKNSIGQLEVSLNILAPSTITGRQVAQIHDEYYPYDHSVIPLLDPSSGQFIKGLFINGGTGSVELVNGHEVTAGRRYNQAAVLPR